MVDDEKYEVAFEIIACAGDAKSLALMAIEEARNGNFEQAEKNLAEAREQMAKAHDVQNDMLQSEAQGKSVELNIVLIHAEDHLTMAIMSIDFAEEFIELFCKIINKHGTQERKNRYEDHAGLLLGNVHERRRPEDEGRCKGARQGL